MDMATKETDDVAENVKQGFGLLWKAAKQAAKGVKRDVTATTVSKTIEDAGREIARAATNVAEKVGTEIKKIAPHEPDYVKPDDERMKPPYEQDDAHPPAKKGPTASDPGFRIAIDDDEKKPRK